MKNSSRYQLHISFDELVRQLLRVLRGGLTQRQLSRKLGFSFSQFHRWETGQKRLTWKEFVCLCAVTKRDLREILTNTLNFSGDPQCVQSLIQQIAPHASAKEIANYLQVSVQTARRWLNGSVVPVTSVVFELIAIYTGDLAPMCAQIADIEQLPALRQIRAREERANAVVRTLPLANLVFHSLDMDAYHRLRVHKPGLIASLCGITLAEEQKALKALTEAGIIKLYNGKFCLLMHSITTSGDIVSGAASTAYLTRRALTRFKSPDQPPIKRPPESINNFAHIAGPISVDTAKKVQAIWNKAFFEISLAIATDSGPKERLQGLVYHFFDLRSTEEPNP